jgi:hypothetical protein
MLPAYVLNVDGYAVESNLFKPMNAHSRAHVSEGIGTVDQDLHRESAVGLRLNAAVVKAAAFRLATASPRPTSPRPYDCRSDLAGVMFWI